MNNFILLSDLDENQYQQFFGHLPQPYATGPLALGFSTEQAAYNFATGLLVAAGVIQASRVLTPSQRARVVQQHGLFTVLPVTQP